MKKILLFASVIAFALVARGDNGGRPFSTSMTGAQETGAADPDGSGEAVLQLNPGQQQVCFQITVSNILLPASAAHIHEAPVGVAGPIVIGLAPPNASGFVSGCVSADRDEILEIMQHPEDYYVNVHNSEFPAGAVRGQLSK